MTFTDLHLYSNVRFDVFHLPLYNTMWILGGLQVRPVEYRDISVNEAGICIFIKLFNRGKHRMIEDLLVESCSDCSLDQTG